MTSKVTHHILAALNSIRDEGRPIVTSSMTVQECLDRGISQEEVQFAIYAAIGEEPTRLVLTGKMTMTDVSNNLSDIGYSSVERKFRT